MTRLFAFYISVFRVFSPYPHALRPLRPCDKKPPRPKPRRRSGFCGTNDPRRSRSALTPQREPYRRADTVWSQNIQKTKIKPERDKPLIALLKKMPHSNVRSSFFRKITLFSMNSFVLCPEQRTNENEQTLAKRGKDRQQTKKNQIEKYRLIR